MTLQQLLLILKARIRTVLLLFILTVVAATATTLLMTKQYTASAAIVVDVKAPDLVSGLSSIAPGYLATQVDIISSDRVALEVVKNLKMEESVAIQAQWREATNGKGQLREWLATLLQQKLNVIPSRESNVINIAYSGTDPEFAATIANAFVKAYMDVNLDLRVAPARQFAAFFEEQTKAAREKLEKAQQALSDYQQKNGITSTDERLDFETAKLNETSSQLTGVQAQTTDSQSKRQASKAETVAEVMQSPLINGLKADIARLESKLSEIKTNLGQNHPQILQAEAELSTLRSKLDSETKKITASVETAYQVGKQREAQLQGALAVQKGRVLLLNKQRDELNVLRRDIESAQRAFEIVSQRASQTNIESQTNQTNIGVLSEASIPQDPSKPRVFINLLASVFLGLFLGIGVALILEFRNRKVRSIEDLVDALEIPVLGSISSATGMYKRNLIGFKA